MDDKLDIKRLKKGYKVVNPATGKRFSDKPLSKAKAVRQVEHIELYYKQRSSQG